MKNKLLRSALGALLAVAMTLGACLPVAAAIPDSTAATNTELSAGDTEGAFPSPIPMPEEKEENADLNVEARTLSIKDKVRIKYAVPTESDNARMLFWTKPQSNPKDYVYGTHQQEVKPSYEQNVGGKQCSVFQYTDLFDRQMTDVIYARAYEKVGDEYRYGEVTKYSVVEYAYNMEKNGKLDSQLRAVLDALLNRGAAAQKKYSYKLDSLANATYNKIHVVDGLLSDGFADMICPEGMQITGITVYLRITVHGTVYGHSWSEAGGTQELTGYQKLDDHIYHFLPGTGAVRGTKYDGHTFDAHGRLTDNGFVSIAPGRTYYIIGYIIIYGYHSVNNSLYYFGSDGLMQSDTEVDGRHIGADGIVKVDNEYIKSGKYTYYVVNSVVICVYVTINHQTYLKTDAGVYPASGFNGTVQKSDKDNDATNNRPVGNVSCVAEIKELGLSFEVKSDEKGNFKFPLLPKVQIILIFIVEGYAESRMEFNFATSNALPGNVLLDSLFHSVVVDSGMCGSDMSWTVYENVEDKEKRDLEIKGSGEMNDYTATNKAPWDKYSKDIVMVDIDESVTNIGSYAFAGFSSLADIQLPSSIKEIGDKAFFECDILKDVVMPDDVKIGVDVFRGSIYVVIVVVHTLEYVPAKEATCTEAGNTAHYACNACDEYYADPEGKERIYNINIPASHNFVSGYCNKCGTYQNSVLITSIDKVAHLGKFALGTMEDAIGLPDKIMATTADGRRHELSVTWELTDYKKETAGSYTIRGHVNPGSLHFADSVSGEITAELEVVEFMQGTADIVFILDTSGSMGSYINNVKNNIIKFAQAIEDKGVSARWSVVTYSDFTVNSANEETKIIYNGATPWFTTASDYKTAISSIELAWGGDGPEAGIDGLMAANYNLETRQNARTFYILLTDADSKINNHYGVTSMYGAGEILADNGINTSVITGREWYSHYSPLTSQTNGITADIYDNFSQDLLDGLVPKIYEGVIA